MVIVQIVSTSRKSKNYENKLEYIMYKKYLVIITNMTHTLLLFLYMSHLFDITISRT